MKLAFTVTQKQRLVELDIADDVNRLSFDTAEERDDSFKKINQDLVRKNKERLRTLISERLRPVVRLMETDLANSLRAAGFVEVITPTILSKGMLGKMGITEGRPLFKQVFWLGNNSCLRPMLAPNLYYLLGHMTRDWPRPVRIFEIGQCFRKESKGAKHLSEFTMLNLVEMGMGGDPQRRLEELARLVMDTVGLDFNLVPEDSEVYGDTTDVMAGDLEVASGATGPHPLDVNWNIAENWAGLGFGIERLVIAKEGFQNIRRAGRSLVYMDGARLNI